MSKIHVKIAAAIATISNPTAALADPIMQCDRSQYEAEEWFESVYGSGRTQRNDTLTDPGAPYDDYRSLPEADQVKSGRIR